MKSRLLILLIVLFVTVGLDRWTKILATDHLKNAGRLSYLGDTVRLDYAKNSGAFLSLGASLPTSVRGAVFTWAVAALLGFLVYLCLARPSMPRRMRIALSLVLAGGAGNLWDRIAEDGHVTDFMNLGIGPLRTGIFNVADIAIVAGVVLLAWPEKKPKAPQATQSTEGV
jgi:signal peptidase II